MKETAYLLQASLIALWWVGLAVSERFFLAFQFDGIGPQAFWAFLLPDLAVIASLSVVRSYRKVASIELILFGAFCYAALYCLNAMLLTSSGLLPTALMLLGLMFNGFLCFHHATFRPAGSHSLYKNAAKTLVQVVCVWFLALVLAPYVLLDAFGGLVWPGSPLISTLGAVGFVLASALGITSAYYLVRDGDGTPLPLDQTNRLVTRGPYRVVRNPMALAGIGQGFSIALMFLSLPILAYSVLGAVVWHMVVRPVEEEDMLRRFGDAYRDYRSRVSVWAPRLW